MIRRIYEWFPNEKMRRAGATPAFLSGAEGSDVFRSYEYGDVVSLAYMEQTGTLTELIAITPKKGEKP